MSFRKQYVSLSCQPVPREKGTDLSWAQGTVWEGCRVQPPWCTVPDCGGLACSGSSAAAPLQGTASLLSLCALPLHRRAKGVHFSLFCLCLFQTFWCLGERRGERATAEKRICSDAWVIQVRETMLSLHTQSGLA